MKVYCSTVHVSVPYLNYRRLLKGYMQSQIRREYENRKTHKDARN